MYRYYTYVSISLYMSLRIRATFKLHTHTCLILFACVCGTAMQISWHDFNWHKNQWISVDGLRKRLSKSSRGCRSDVVWRCASYVGTFTFAVPLHQINWPVWFWLDLESCGTLICQPSLEVETHFTILHPYSLYVSLCNMRSGLWRIDGPVGIGFSFFGVLSPFFSRFFSNYIIVVIHRHLWWFLCISHDQWVCHVVIDIYRHYWWAVAILQTER